MTEKSPQTNMQERRVLVNQLIIEGFTSSRSIAKVLREKHGIEVHHSTVARDMEQLHGESGHSTNGDPESEHNRHVQGYEDRVQKLTEMLDDPDLSKREKLAVIRTLNETGRQLLALRDKRKEKKSGEETEEGRHARIAMQIEQMRKNGEEYQRKQRIKWRAELKDELRQEIMQELESEIA